MHKIRQFNIFLIILVLIISTAILASCTPKESNPAVESLPIKLKIGGTTLMAGAVLEVTEAKGFFDEENLDVEITRVDSSKVTMAALESGELDIVFASRSAGTFNHLFKNEQLRIIADVQRVAPIIIVRKDLHDSIKKIEDLKEKIFATPRAGSASQYFLARVLENAGLSLNDITSKDLEAQEAVVALEARNIDAAIINEPYATLAINKGIGVRLAEAEINQLFPQGQQHAFLVATTDFLANQKTAEKFFRAYKKAADYYLRAKQGSEPERQEVVRIVAEYTGVEPEIISQVEWIDISADLKPDIEYMKEAQEWYFQNGFLDEKVNLDDKIDLTFLP